jgi:hypothetical protein
VTVVEAFAHPVAEVLSVPSLLVRERSAPGLRAPESEEDLVLDPEPIEEFRERVGADSSVRRERSGVALLRLRVLVAEHSKPGGYSVTTTASPSGPV